MLEVDAAHGQGEKNQGSDQGSSSFDGFGRNPVHYSIRNCTSWKGMSSPSVILSEKTQPPWDFKDVTDNCDFPLGSVNGRSGELEAHHDDDHDQQQHQPFPVLSHETHSFSFNFRDPAPASVTMVRRRQD
jgi:hypothetical protein